jgi:hypothetical protein
MNEYTALVNEIAHRLAYARLYGRKELASAIKHCIPLCDEALRIRTIYEQAEKEDVIADIFIILAKEIGA